MPTTVRDLLRVVELGLVVRAGEDALDHPISWVHASELDDPTPFITGGELVLTTGQFGEGTEEHTSYVKRLVAADVAGVGFGLGLPHQRTPPTLVRAAREAGLPLFEVPLRTTFISISKSVCRALAAEEHAEARRTYDAQQALTHAAAGPDGFGAVSRLLGRQLEAWIVLLDAADAVVVAEPPSATDSITELRDVLDRLRTARAPASAALQFDDREVLLQSLGRGPRLRGFIAAGRCTPFSGPERQLFNSAVSLLSVGLESSHSLDAAERQLRAGIYCLLSSGQLDAARSIARELCGGLPIEPIRVFALVGRQESRSAATELLKPAAARMRERVFHTERDDVTLVLVRDGGPLGSWLQDLPIRLEALSLGVSEAADYDHFKTARRQAVQAAETCAPDRKSVARFAELREGGLGLFMDPLRAETFAAALIDPLARHDQTGRGDLVNSVRVWLEHNGQWDPAAVHLGVHRHTLRQRIRKAEQLIERPFDSPSTRSELWLALQVLGGAPA